MPVTIRTLHAVNGGVAEVCRFETRSSSAGKRDPIDMRSAHAHDLREIDSRMADVASTSQSSLYEFDPNLIRQRYAAAFKPKPWVYWCDLILSAAIGWSAFAYALTQPLGSVGHIVAVLAATFALLRGALFIHELAHLRAGALPHFEIGWHLLVGIPLMLPSLMYVGSHGDHHRKASFGTVTDPEYAPIASWSRARIVRFVLEVAVVPMILPLRWGVLGPLSYMHPGLRKLVVEKLSTLVINPDYRRPMPEGKQAERWAVQEGIMGWVAWIAFTAWLMGWLTPHFLITWLCVPTGILLVNQIRTLAAHRYENDGAPVDSHFQLMDSINLRGIPVLTALVAPVGLRYHALHHFLPSVPYHSLGTLHRQLIRELPQEAPYHETEAGGVVTAVRHLWDKAPA